MNKKVFGRKLSRSRPAREALFATLIRAMILNGKIVTTKAKAKAIQGDLEHMVTLAKKGDLNSRKRALSYLDNASNVVGALFSDVAKAFAGRTSGFSRIINLPARRGDNAKIVRIEWTEKVELKAKEPKVKKVSAKAEKTAKADKKEAKKPAKK